MTEIPTPQPEDSSAEKFTPVEGLEPSDREGTAIEVNKIASIAESVRDIDVEYKRIGHVNLNQVHSLIDSLTDNEDKITALTMIIGHPGIDASLRDGCIKEAARLKTEKDAR